MIFHDGTDWRSWIEVGEGLVEIKMWPAESYYFGRSPESKNDFTFHFLNFVSQNSCFLQLQKAVAGIRDDLFNIAAAIAKIRHFESVQASIGQGVARMVMTEVEYLLSLCRSIFDLLQEVVTKTWATVKFIDPSREPKRLKGSFREMVMSSNEPMTALAISEKFSIPMELARFYSRSADFFLSLRRFRDNIVHNGSTIQTIFATEDGFYIQRSFNPFASIDLWREEERKPNDLVPLLPALGFLIHGTLSACNDYSSTIESIVLFPPPVAPGFQLYMRGYFNDSFVSLLTDAEGRVRETAGSLMSNAC
ncbi:hypothetical protein A7X91_02590 [Stenotrophomonas maltophilia]|nr:hypothetical protein A7X91_02590 [Stenotrophomonas maltophilia]